MADLGSCTNPDHGYARAEMTCLPCLRDYCHEHAKHPDHEGPLDRLEVEAQAGSGAPPTRDGIG